MFLALTEKANAVLRKEFSVADLEAQWSVPQESSFGDASLRLPLQLASRLKKKPRDVAQVFVDALAGHPDVANVEIAGAGYVNVWLTTEAILQELELTEGAQVAQPARKNEAPVIVEYSQPNIAKPLGIHHLIGTAIGQATANLYRHAGYQVLAWNYIGDWGTQFGKLAVAYERWGKKPVRDHTIDELLQLYVRFHEEADQDESLEAQGREEFRKLEQGDKKLRAFWQDVVMVTKAALADVYRRLDVSFDLDLGESFYEDKMEQVLEEGKKKKVFTEGEAGSFIVQFPEKKNIPPYLVLKGDGATLYSTRDLAQMRYRIDTYHPQEILIFTDIAQKLHFEQLLETCKMLGWTLPAFENVLFGRMRFTDKAMSTRKGNILNLEQVLDEAVARAEAIIRERGETIQTDDPKALAEMMGVGALVYAIVSQNRKIDLVFDWDKMLSFEGNSAPYLQYTYARARSVLRKAGAESAGLPKVIQSLTEKERILIRTLLQFPAVLEDARESRMPHKLATYLFALCQDFNAFYTVDPILHAEGSQRELRLALTSFVAAVLKAGSSILSFRVPERM